MAEPRKPRVIRTRTPANPAAPSPATPATPQAEQAVPAPAAAKPPASTPLAGTVRGTSDKVAVLPVPAAAEPGSGKTARRVPRPRAGAIMPAVARIVPKKLVPEKVAPGKPGPGHMVTQKSGGDEASSRKVPSRKAAAGKAAAPRVVRSAVVPDQGASGHARPAKADSGTSGNTSSGGGDHAGAQVLAFPMPSHKRRRRTLLLSAAAVVAVLALVMGIALFSPALAVKTVVFDGNKLVSEDTLQLAVLPLVSKPLPQVTGEEVSSLLESVVQVKSSRIEARPPSTLVVHVVERVPVALLKTEKGYSLVDQDGVELGTTKDPATAGLPLIDGGKAAIGQDTFRAMTGVLATLPKSILVQLANATAKSPDAVELSLVDGRSVIWGNASDMELKAQVLEALLTAPTPTAQVGKPEPVPANVFDVSAPRHPVTR